MIPNSNETSPKVDSTVPTRSSAGASASLDSGTTATTATMATITDRHVDQEDGAPPVVFEQEAAGERPDDDAEP